jgi:hypothetical protein
MAKNKKKSFSKVSVSSPILNSSENEQIKVAELNTITPKLDVDENKLLSKEVIELPNAVTSDEFTETIKSLETSELTKTKETLCNEDNRKVSETNLDIEYRKNDEVIAFEIVEPEVTLEHKLDKNISSNEEKNIVELTEIQIKYEEQNISNNDKKNSVELTEIQIINEESVTPNKNSTNCGRKYCSIL